MVISETFTLEVALNIFEEAVYSILENAMKEKPENEEEYFKIVCPLITKQAKALSCDTVRIIRNNLSVFESTIK